jgi:hypothetical protein
MSAIDTTLACETNSNEPIEQSDQVLYPSDQRHPQIRSHRRVQQVGLEGQKA